MTNAEKFLKDGVNKEEMSKSFFDYLISDGVYGCNSTNIVEKWENFLNKEIQLTLTEDERVILKNIAKHNDFEKIGRDKIGGLYLTCRINIPTVEKWEISFFDHLFQLIKERRRI